jgi:hypothetical protein
MIHEEQSKRDERSQNAQTQIQIPFTFLSIDPDPPDESRQYDYRHAWYPQGSKCLTQSPKSSAKVQSEFQGKFPNPNRRNTRNDGEASAEEDLICAAFLIPSRMRLFQGLLPRRNDRFDTVSSCPKLLQLI